MSNTVNAKRPDRDGAPGAETLSRTQDVEFYPHYNRFPVDCQTPTIEALERSAAYHRDRARRFATLAGIAWQFGDQLNRRKMQRAQWAEARILDAIVRVLLGAGEASHERP
jgi:hypothetical protein